MEGIKTELLKFAFTGVNIIPTVALLVMQVFWLIAITGLLDVEVLDFDLDLEGSQGPLGALSILMNIGQVPLALVLSILILDNWLLVMFMYFLPIDAGGLVTGLLMVPALIVSISLTKAQVLVLKKIFPDTRHLNDIEYKVLYKRGHLLCDLSSGRLGQVSIRQTGPAVVVNVETLFEDQTFQKGDLAYIIKKDDEKDLYYISKSLIKD